MDAVDSSLRETSSTALPGLARALILAGKLGQKSAEEIYRKTQAARTSFIAELTGSGAVSAFGLAHTMCSAYAAPLVDLDAIDPKRLPRDLLDGKICNDYRVVVLGKRNNRLIVATADPSDSQAAEKIKFASQLGVDWVIAEYDKLLRLVTANATTASETIDSIIGDEFEFDETAAEASMESASGASSEVDDAPVVRFLHKMLLDAFSMRASDLHFEPYEHNYRVRFRDRLCLHTLWLPSGQFLLVRLRPSQAVGQSSAVLRHLFCRRRRAGHARSRARTAQPNRAAGQTLAALVGRCISVLCLGRDDRSKVPGGARRQ